MKLELTWFPSELDFQTFILKISSGIFQIFSCLLVMSNVVKLIARVDQNNSFRPHLESTNMLKRRKSEYE